MKSLILALPFLISIIGCQSNAKRASTVSESNSQPPAIRELQLTKTIQDNNNAIEPTFILQKKQWSAQKPEATAIADKLCDLARIECVLASNLFCYARERGIRNETRA